jgi:HK97 family phage prohead protease
MSVLVEGYASLFGFVDREGDVVRRGAFRESLAARPVAPLLLAHDPRLAAGASTHLREDDRGLFVKGAIDPTRTAGRLAIERIRRGVDGLSIGFRVRASRPRMQGGRDLFVVDLVEISIVSEPMAPAARLTRIGWSGAVAPNPETTHAA